MVVEGLFEAQEGPTDAELIAAWGQAFTSQAGTYERNGSTLTYTINVAKSPNGMLPQNATYSRDIVRLTSNRLETSGTNAAGVTLINRYTRVE